jgi:acylphosphatase
VRNLADGRVEVLFEGEEAAVIELSTWLEQGPRHAEVAELELQPQALQGVAGFVVRR